MSEASLSAYVYSIALLFAVEDTARKNATTEFIRGQIARMPRLIRCGLRVLFTLAGIYCVVRTGRPLRNLDPAARARFCLNLKSSALGPFRDLAQFLFSFCALGFYS